MKTIRLLSLLSLIAGGLVFSVRAETPAAAAGKPTLQLQVDAPYVTDLINRNDIVDALSSRVREGLARATRGLDIKELINDEPASDRPLLSVTLIRWDQTRTGDIECRFSAEYQAAGEKHSLGVFEGRTPSVMRSRGFGGEDFGRAAEDAGRELGEALRKKKLI